VKSITVAVPTLAVKSLKDLSVNVPPRRQHQRPAHKPPKPPSVPTCAAATVASSLVAAAAAVAANPTPTAASLPAGCTTEHAISGNTGTRLPVVGSNSDPKTNVTTEGNANVANLKISDDMDTQAE